MHEFELIDRYFRRSGGRGVALGIGDDGAVLDLPPGRQLVAVVDTLVEGVHYPRQIAAADIGYRAVAVNLSDIAAMGAVPAWMTLALTLPAADPEWLEGFSRGLLAAAQQFDIALVGGDTTAGKQTVVSVQLLGHVADKRFLSRSGCRPGDSIYVSGTPGDAAAGLIDVLNGNDGHDLAQRFLRPTPRIELGLSAVGVANAAIDVSDGLCADLQRMLSASACGGTIEQEKLPLSTTLVERYGSAEAARFALTGGDDYELLFAVSAGNEDEFLDACATVGVPVTSIGQAEAHPGLRVTAGDTPLKLDTDGYRHFNTTKGEAV